MNNLDRATMRKALITAGVSTRGLPDTQLLEIFNKLTCAARPPYPHSMLTTIRNRYGLKVIELESVRVKFPANNESK